MFIVVQSEKLAVIEGRRDADMMMTIMKKCRMWTVSQIVVEQMQNELEETVQNLPGLTMHNSPVML